METALKTGGIAFNLAGGYHHAWHDRGEGFCLYADVIIALRYALQSGILGSNDRVLYIDLDAHQGNGVCRQLLYYELNQVTVFDMYARDNYPGDKLAIGRIDVGHPLPPRTGDANYLGVLCALLPEVFAVDSPRLVIYNAGTDILDTDPLGELGVSEAGVMDRDRFVIDTCLDKQVPLVIVPSGGYTERSHVLVARLMEYLITKSGDAHGAC